MAEGPSLRPDGGSRVRRRTRGRGGREEKNLVEVDCSEEREELERKEGGVIKEGKSGSHTER